MLDSHFRCKAPNTLFCHNPNRQHRCTAYTTVSSQLDTLNDITFKQHRTRMCGKAEHDGSGPVGGSKCRTSGTMFHCLLTNVHQVTILGRRCSLQRRFLTDECR